MLNPVVITGHALVFSFCSVCTALEWTSASIVTNGSTIHACEGDTVNLLWYFTTDPAEHVVDVEWYFHQQDQSDLMIATYIAGNFIKIPTASHRLEFVTNAGIKLLNVSLSEFGVYSVRINYNVHGAAIENVQEVLVAKPDPPVSTYSRLSSQLLPGAVWDSSTGQLHAQVECGHFADPGNPPVAVTWKTPLGGYLNSTNYTDGYFVLNLPNPVTHGNYTCQLELPPPTTKCGRVPSPLMWPATVSVDGVGVQLAIMAARLAAVEQDNLHLTQDNSQLRQDLQTMQQQLQLLPCFQDSVHRPRNCIDVRQYSETSGVHCLYLHDNTTVRVYCNQDTDRGGWTVIQRRQNGSLDFNRNWTTYEDGFGDLKQEFWFGLRNIYYLTSSGNYILRVDLTDWDDSTAFAVYETFYIDGPDQNYKLHVASFSGTAGDSLITNDQWGHDNRPFSTPERDHDTSFDTNCADLYKSGWWFGACVSSNLNGQYGHAGNNDRRFLVWWYWKRDYRSYKKSEMKIRPRS